jgi:ribosomal protein S18 acetylase RimI-like enzyme
MRLRAPHPEDAAAVFAVQCERDIADFGAPDCTLDDLLDEWRASDFDLAADARLCEDSDGRIMGYASVRLPGTYGATSPGPGAHEADGLLLEWAERRQRELGWERHRQAVAASNPSGKELLERAGYTLRRSHWRMELALDGELQEPAAPAGVSFRALDPGGDAETLYRLDRASFAEVAETQPESIEHFAERHLGAHDLDSGLSAVACRGPSAVGFLLARRWPEESTGFVDILAVAPAEQGRGVGGALLRRAFVMFRAAGLARAQLGVAGDNPRALRLYERVGMTPRFQVDAYERAPSALRPEQA